MAAIDYSTKEVRLRFALVGPAGAGKTTLLSRLHALLPAKARGPVEVKPIGADQLVTFEFTPPELEPLGDHTVRATIFTFPGRLVDPALCARAYSDVDALLFVVDSRETHLTENAAVLRQLSALPMLADVPIAFFYNKRDLPNAVSPSELRRRLNPLDAIQFAGSAANGEGVNTIVTELVRVAFVHAA